LHNLINFYSVSSKNYHKNVRHLLQVQNVVQANRYYSSGEIVSFFVHVYWTGLYTATKTNTHICELPLLNASKNSVLIARRQVYISGKFNIRLWLSGLLNCTIDSDIKVLNHILLMLASDHDEQKTKPSYKILH
jgi:hypothetical protein